MYFIYVAQQKTFFKKTLYVTADFEVLQHLQFSIQDLRKWPFYIQFQSLGLVIWSCVLQWIYMSL